MSAWVPAVMLVVKGVLELEESLMAHTGKGNDGWHRLGLLVKHSAMQVVHLGIKLFKLRIYHSSSTHR